MRAGRLLASFVAMLIAGNGCMTPSTLENLHRMDEYRPMVETVAISNPAPVQAAKATVKSSLTQEAVELVVKKPPAKIVEASKGEAPASDKAAVPVATDTDNASTTSTPSDNDEEDAGPDNSGKAQGLRNLSRGDRIMISLRGIPRPEEIKNIIDGLGEVTLPYIGQVRVAGLTPSDAERLIETTYVNLGIYRTINVIVVAEDKVYFVQGEVARQGKFSMSGDVTLLQAITEAGGYTPFANRRNVKIIRGEQVLFYNARDIANGRNSDPVIASDDIIVVLRSVF